jgi:hypothetical protein
MSLSPLGKLWVPHARWPFTLPALPSNKPFTGSGCVSWYRLAMMIEKTKEASTCAALQIHCATAASIKRPPFGTTAIPHSPWNLYSGTLLLSLGLSFSPIHTGCVGFIGFYL